MKTALLLQPTTTSTTNEHQLDVGDEMGRDEETKNETKEEEEEEDQWGGLRADILDWTSPSSFDHLSPNLVMAADVVYDPIALPSLVSLITHLKDMNPGLEIIISTTRRNEETFQLFKTLLTQNNFSFQHLTHSPPLFHCDNRQNVHLWKLTTFI